MYNVDVDYNVTFYVYLLMFVTCYGFYAFASFFLRVMEESCFTNGFSFFFFLPQCSV